MFATVVVALDYGWGGVDIGGSSGIGLAAVEISLETNEFCSEVSIRACEVVISVVHCIFSGVTTGINEVNIFSS